MNNPDIWKDIIDFHEKFDNNYDGPPQILSEEMRDFRKTFMFEELEEYCDADAGDDLHDMFDALIDLVYVAVGTDFLLRAAVIARLTTVCISIIRSSC